MSTSKKSSNNNDSLAMRIVVDLITRIVYFAGTFLLLFVLELRLASKHPDFDWTFCIYLDTASGICAALFGPLLYRINSDQGKGTLDKVKQNRL